MSNTSEFIQKPQTLGRVRGSDSVKVKAKIRIQVIYQNLKVKHTNE